MAAAPEPGDNSTGSTLLLRNFSTMKIGGTAERIVRLSELVSEIELPPPIRILGNGSNVLIDDRGLKGSVIITREPDRLDQQQPRIIERNSNGVLIEIPGGFFLPTLSRWATQNELTGCEFMAVIPGTVGGGLIQNVGAHEQELKDIFDSADIFDLNTRTLETWSSERCELSYRHSRLKAFPEKLVKSVILRLQPGTRLNIEKRIEANVAYRKQKTPYSKPSLGSIFTRLQGPDGQWVFPGKLIEDAELKGKRIGGAEVSPIHANYIVNEGNATFLDVITLIELIEQRVLEHSGYRLKQEIAIWSDLGDVD